MRIDISLLPALAAAFMLVFARIGAMVMLLPGLGEANIPVRIKLAIALLLTLVILPLHRAAYNIDMQSVTALLVLMMHEIVIGIVLGATARVTLSALQVAGSVIAQQLGLGFVTSVDPTQGQLYDLCAGRADGERRCRLARDQRLLRRLQDRDSTVGAVPGVWHRLQYRAWRAGAADAAR